MQKASVVRLGGGGMQIANEAVVKVGFPISIEITSNDVQLQVEHSLPEILQHILCRLSLFRQHVIEMHSAALPVILPST